MSFYEDFKQSLTKEEEPTLKEMKIILEVEVTIQADTPEGFEGAVMNARSEVATLLCNRERYCDEEDAEWRYTISKGLPGVVARRHGVGTRG